MDTTKQIIIVINGAPESGKDTFCGFFMDYMYEHYGRYVFVHSTIKKPKQIAKLMGWDGIKNNKSRKLLSDIKMAWCEFNNGPFESTKNFIKYGSKITSDSIFIIHCREPREIEKIKQAYGEQCKTLLIRRLSILQSTYNYSDLNINIENYSYDYIINNEQGITNLRTASHIFIENFFNENMRKIPVTTLKIDNKTISVKNVEPKIGKILEDVINMNKSAKMIFNNRQNNK